jgi:hypothetical protein
MLMADLQDGVDGRYIHSGYDHRFHASCTLTSNDLFTIGDKRLFIYVAMSIKHNIQFTIYKFTIYDLFTISRFAGFTIYGADNRQFLSIVHQSYLVNRQIVN